MTKFNINDYGWVAIAGRVEKTETCPHCFGQRVLTVILGDGSSVSIDCAGCQQGYEPPRGYITTYVFESKAQKIRIDGIDCTNSKETEYKYDMYGGGYRTVKESDIFNTEAEALVRAKILAEENHKQELNRLNCLKEYQHRTWAWNATYHRKCLKEALRNIEYHTAKLNVAKAKSKEDKKSFTDEEKAKQYLEETIQTTNQMLDTSKPRPSDNKILK